MLRVWWCLLPNNVITINLPLNSLVRDTPWEEFLDNTIGRFFECLEEEVEAMNEGLFIESASGKYLDLHGKDLGLPRKADEDDEHYRNRLLVEPLDEFNVTTLYDVYDVQLLSYKADKTDLTLLSDNHLLSNEYFVDASDELWSIIQRKFITGEVLHRWS